MTENLSQNELLSLTTEIVASHLSNNTVAVSEIPQLIKLVYRDPGDAGGRGGEGAAREADAGRAHQEVRDA